MIVTINWNLFEQNPSQFWKEISEAKQEASKRLEARRKKQEEDRIKALKKLPIGADIYYTGTEKELFLKSGKKSKDGRNYMVAAFNGKLWKIPYSRIRIEPLTEDEIKNKKLSDTILGMINGR